MSDDEMRAELERLKQENEALKKQQGRTIRLQVGKKGGASLYGLGRFPVTLYKEQWMTLLDSAGMIKDFIKEHDAELKSRGSD
ncbi:MAG: hypothetical protein ABIJ96_00940 [Elusimicrobiota bacterium]